MAKEMETMIMMCRSPARCQGELWNSRHAKEMPWRGGQILARLDDAQVRAKLAELLERAAAMLMDEEPPK